MQSSHLLEVGLKRTINEDDLFYDIVGQTGIFALADGMGGHGGGKEASAMALSVFKDLWREHAAFIEGKKYNKAYLLKIMKYGFEMANYEIFSYNVKNNKKMGTTLSVVIVMNTEMLVMHVGDSRAYWVSENQIQRLTDDDTKRFSDLKNGFISKAYYDMNPSDNRLTKCIGLKQQICPQFYEQRIAYGDQLFLCSDGIHQYMNDQKLLEILTRPRVLDGDQKLEYIKHDVVSNGASDNFSAILVEF